MGKPSLKQQIEQKLREKLSLGTKKRDSKGKDIIRSRVTLLNYLRECLQFARYIRAKYPDRGINTLEKLWAYVEEYLTRKKPNGKEYSAWTICLRRAAIAKLYGVSCQDVMKNAPKRLRKNIKRSRWMDAAPVPPVEDQPPYEALGRGAGLRRADFSRVRKEDITKNEEHVLVFIDKGKGGKERRIVVVLPEYADRVLLLAEETEPGERVIPKGTVPLSFPSHACRRYYANTMYHLLARPIAQLERKDKYFCRGDRKGIVLDRYAMKLTSRYLGHGSYNPKTGKWRDRISVISVSYLSF